MMRKLAGATREFAPPPPPPLPPPLSTAASVVPILISSIHLVPRLELPVLFWRVPPKRKKAMFVLEPHRMVLKFWRSPNLVQFTPSVLTQTCQIPLLLSRVLGLT